jgi:hypothetical protein
LCLQLSSKRYSFLSPVLRPINLFALSVSELQLNSAQPQSMHSSSPLICQPHLGQIFICLLPPLSV